MSVLQDAFCISFKLDQSQKLVESFLDLLSTSSSNLMFNDQSTIINGLKATDEALDRGKPKQISPAYNG